MTKRRPLDELKRVMRGMFHLVLTPFDENDEVDEDVLRGAIRKAKGAYRGKEVVFMGGGSTAEFYAMTDEECRRFISVIVDEIGGEFPVVIGTGRPGTRYTIEVSRFAQEAGADAVMVMNPYYFNPTDQGLYRHFAAVAEAVDIGVFLYNSPAQTKLCIPLDMLVELSRIANIIGVKENASNPILFHRMMRSIDPADMVVVCGSGHEMFPYAALCGCRSLVTEVGNFAAGPAIEMYEAGRDARFDRLMACVDRLDPYVRFREKIALRATTRASVLAPSLSPASLSFFVAVCKEAMRITGTPYGRVREPLENLTEDDTAELEATLKGITS